MQNLLFAQLLFLGEAGATPQEGAYV